MINESARNGDDVTRLYRKVSVRIIEPACGDDCGGRGTAYLYQNFPGPGTLAKNDDPTPMHDFWVDLFY